MRHRRRNAKLGRTSEHRNAMLANLACSLIKTERVITTLAKAKAVRPVAEKLVTLGKKGEVHHRRLAAARLRQQARTHFKGTPTQKGSELREAWRENEDVVHILFDKIAPGFVSREGGYTRIIKLHRRRGDAAEMAIIEWVERGEDAAPKAEKKAKAKSEKKEKAEEAPAEESVAEEAEEPKAEAAEGATDSDESSEEDEKKES